MRQMSGQDAAGFMSCPESVPDPFQIADGVEKALAELEAAAPA